MHRHRSLPFSHRFGSFELLTTPPRLLADGRDVRLGARALELLLVLVERAGAVISRDELLDAVWSGVMVEENNIAVQVTALRKVLGRGAIVTEPGRGYRFSLLPVEENFEAREGAADTANSVAAKQPSAAEQTMPLAPAWGLPAAGPPLLGRAHDFGELMAEMRVRRLVTIVGPVGIGKTALALAVGHAQRAVMRDGVVWVDLSAVEHPVGVMRHIAQTLGLLADDAGDLMCAFATYIKSKQMLLVLDNAEHLVAEVARVSHAVLAGVNELHLLVTSQAALNVAGERLFRLSALSVPSDAACSPDEAMQHGAVALFVDQARAQDRRFSLNDSNVAGIVAMCRELDGLALSIKLAAARLPMFGLKELGSRLIDRFRVLRGDALGVPVRQQSLRAAMDWSHSLLSMPERLVFRRLGVFVNGFSLDLACIVSRDESIDDGGVEEALESMVDRSLVTISHASEPPRYQMLLTTRAYALLRLAQASEEQAIRERHAHALRRLCQRESPLGGAQPLRLARCEIEIDNLRAALEWLSRHDTEAAVTLLADAADVLDALGLFNEARELFHTFDASVHRGLPDELLARYRLCQSQLVLSVNPRVSRDLAMRATALYRAGSDAEQRYLALSQAIPLVAFLSIPDARDMLDEQARLETAQTSPYLRCLRQVAEAFVLAQQGRQLQAREAIRLALSRPAQSSEMPQWLLADLPEEEGESEDLQNFEAGLVRTLALGAGVPRLHRLNVLGLLTAALIETDCLPEARQVLTELLTTSRAIAWDGFHLWVDLLAWLAAKERRHVDAARLLGYAERPGPLPELRLSALVAVRQYVTVTVWSGLDAALANELMEEGERLEPESACRLALAAPQREQARGTRLLRTMA